MMEEQVEKPNRGGGNFEVSFVALTEVSSEGRWPQRTARRGVRETKVMGTDKNPCRPHFLSGFRFFGFRSEVHCDFG